MHTMHTRKSFLSHSKKKIQANPTTKGRMEKHACLRQTYERYGVRLLSLGIAHRAGTSQLKNQAQRQRERETTDEVRQNHGLKTQK